MWLHKQTIKDFVALAFKPQYLAYAHIKKTDNHIPYAMINYKLIPFTNLELENQIIFNPTSIGKHLNTLLHENKLSGTDLRISISGPTIFEKIISPDIVLEETDETQLKNLIWHDTPIFNNNQQDSSRYICGISRELLFQYQLLAAKHNLNITCITTSTMALLNSYHMLTTGNNNEHCSRIEDIPSLIPIQEFPKLCSLVPSTDNPLLMAELIGLCLAELNYENN
jgi:hypothetical protein